MPHALFFLSFSVLLKVQRRLFLILEMYWLISYFAHLLPYTRNKPTSDILHAASRPCSSVVGPLCFQFQRALRARQDLFSATHSKLLQPTCPPSPNYTHSQLMATIRNKSHRLICRTASRAVKVQELQGSLRCHWRAFSLLLRETLIKKMKAWVWLCHCAPCDPCSYFVFATCYDQHH